MDRKKVPQWNCQSEDPHYQTKPIASILQHTKPIQLGTLIAKQLFQLNQRFKSTVCLLQHTKVENSSVWPEITRMTVTSETPF